MNNPADVEGKVTHNLKRLRLANGLTLEDMSREMTRVDWPMSINTLSKIENGKRKVSVGDLVAFARVFDVEALALTATPGPFDGADVLKLVPKLQELLEIYERARQMEAMVQSYTSQLAEMRAVQEDLRARLTDTLEQDGVSIAEFREFLLINFGVEFADELVGGT